MSEKNFVNGLRVSRHEKAPSYILVSLGIKVDDFIKWLRENQGGEWMNVDVKLSKTGKYYAELNTYRKGDNTPNQNEEEIKAEDIGF